MNCRRSRWLAVAGVAVVLLASLGGASCGGNGLPAADTPLPATATPMPAETSVPVSPTPTAVTTPDNFGVQPSPLVTASPRLLPAGWTLFAWHLGCYRCGGSFADFRRWTSDGSALSSEFLFSFTQPPGSGTSAGSGVYTVAFDGSGRRIAAGLCTRGYCGGEGEPSSDATAELFRSEDGGRSWRSLGALQRGVFVVGFIGDDVVLRQSILIGDQWESDFLAATGRSLAPPGFKPDRVVLEDGRDPVWVRYGGTSPSDRNHLRSTYQDSGGVVSPPLADTDAVLQGLAGTDGYVWELHTRAASGQGPTVLAIADRAGKVRRAVRWDGRWWSLRDVSGGRYLAGYGDDPSLGPAPAPFIIDLDTATLTPLLGFPRSSSETFTYPMAIVPAP